MNFTGFVSKGLNKLIHSLNGNYIWFETITPTFRSKLWKSAFTFPNGMIVFNFSFYGKIKLWVKYYRRGRSFEVETDKAFFPQDYTGACYVRSPPEETGREAAGPTSKHMAEHRNRVPERITLRIQGTTIRFTVRPIYIMTTLRFMTTFTIWTTATTFTLWIFHYTRVLSTVRSKAATKIDALSGEPLGVIVQNQLFLEDLPQGKLSSKKHVEVTDNGNLNARIPPCGHTETRILIP